MSSRIRLALSLCLISTAAWSGLGQVNMQEGLWEIVTTTDMQSMPGMPKGMKMPAMTIKHCYSAEDVQRNRAMMPNKSECAMTKMQQSGQTSSWTMECRGKESMIIEGTGTFSGDSYSINSRMQFTSGQMKGQAMASRISAKRLGPCPHK
jgi:hypothetical protein